MEVGILRLDGVPTDEVRNRQIVATLIDVALCLQSVEAPKFVLEEGRDGHTKRYFPFRRLFANVEWLGAKRSPTVNALHHLQWSRHTSVSVLTDSHDELARAIAFEIIIEAICLDRHDEELHTSVFPDVLMVLLSHSPNALLLNTIVQQECFAIMGSSELNLGLIGIAFRPVDVGDGRIVNACSKQSGRDVSC